ncbi:hypothetical protein CEUSTIGMA_g11750.t1 [Chlamydomonas eustigma]|uniref:Coenzyme Q-binding protein COQ10 START domain-containing protein n=1 Tax=Chlamydomonas eustigma TaxID=1157962 RepID=A0A250XMM6_9CHLO|nr:hypothetical protein CEUSTIGMA_g11750.t1 [Chlamydomonas eustigma]|eukprot:GAX84328.1 hypothetical protein CEUSTIGMA_g11750.t1 [Chlamydomonas eustigma]
METCRLIQSRACTCSYNNICVLPNRHANLNRRSQGLSGHRVFHLSDQHIRRTNVIMLGNPTPDQNIDGYTPSDYITFSKEKEDRCHHMSGIDVDAPAALCFSIWNDWNRLVDFLDLVNQIGLDPTQKDFALFQCFYRWGMLPVMEIVFLLKKVILVENQHIIFYSVQGMPMSGEVQFIPIAPDKTTVILLLQHQIPDLLNEVKVRKFGLESSLKEIFSQNMEEFKSLAEAMAKDPSSVPPRQEEEERAMPLGIEGVAGGLQIKPLSEVQQPTDGAEMHERYYEEGEYEGEEGEYSNRGEDEYGVEEEEEEEEMMEESSSFRGATMEESPTSRGSRDGVKLTPSQAAKTSAASVPSVVEMPALTPSRGRRKSSAESSSSTRSSTAVLAEVPSKERIAAAPAGKATAGARDVDESVMNQLTVAESATAGRKRTSRAKASPAQESEDSPLTAASGGTKKRVGRSRKSD